jgi:hypothetical protein
MGVLENLVETSVELEGHAFAEIVDVDHKPFPLGWISARDYISPDVGASMRAGEVDCR